MGFILSLCFSPFAAEEQRGECWKLHRWITVSISKCSVGPSQVTKSPAPSPGWRKKNLTLSMTIPMGKKKKKYWEKGNTYILVGQNMYIVHTGFLRCISLASRQRARVIKAPVPYQNMKMWIVFLKFSNFLHCHMYPSPSARFVLLIAWHTPWQGFSLHNSWIFGVSRTVGQQGEFYLGFVSGRWDGA